MTSHVQVLLMQERLRNELVWGESHFREFKSAFHGSVTGKRAQEAKHIARDVGDMLVAFGNADGGTLIVGVEDDGTVTGLPHVQAELEIIRRAPQTHVHADTPLAGVRVNRVALQGQFVLVFDVHKGTRFVHLTRDGRCLQRKDTDTLPLAAEASQFERHEQLSREYDHQWIDGAGLRDLNRPLLQAAMATAAPGLSPEKGLQVLGLAEFGGGMLRLRKAALLLFAADIQKWHARSEIRCLLVAGNELRTGNNYNILRDEALTGNALELLARGWEFVRPFLMQKRLADGVFQYQATYPEAACREALMNAVIHRDYRVEGRSIEVYAFNDKVEIRNPGRLLSTVPLPDLRSGAGVHDSRNVFVTKVIKGLGYRQETGEGMRRIQTALAQDELAPPAIDSVNNSFVMTFFQRRASASA